MIRDKLTDIVEYLFHRLADFMESVYKWKKRL